ncbi:hypothetical protein C8R47DRAFT_1230125 [Mycena vitilis]|nr:hypothetical protein C8R47DRAFT_1230125 [Mycena vitilis]
MPAFDPNFGLHKDNERSNQPLDRLFPHLPPLDPFATDMMASRLRTSPPVDLRSRMNTALPSIESYLRSSAPLVTQARQSSPGMEDLRLPVIRPTVSPCALRNILNPVRNPDAPPPEPSYRRLEFLPVAPAKPVLPPISDGYLYITPSCQPETTAAERYHMYTADFYDPPVKVQVKLRTMPWDSRFFAVDSTPSVFIIGRETFHTSGELQGRWEIDAQLFRTENDVLLRVKEHRKRQVALLFIPRRYTRLREPDPASQKYYQDLVDEEYRSARGLSNPRASGMNTWVDFAQPPVTTATTATASFPPAAIIPHRQQILQWVDTKDPMAFQ